MKNNHYSLFPQLLGVYGYDDNEELKKEINNIIGIYRDTKYEKREEHQGIVHYFNDHDQNLFGVMFEDNEVIQKFKSFLIRKVNLYADEMGYQHPGFFISDAWINICNTGNFQHPHNHVNSFFSGTYYLNYDKEVHPNLRFTNPNLNGSSGHAFMNLDKKNPHQNHINADIYSCDFVEEGDLLIWQSGLSHSYGPSQADERISISMNFFPRYLRQGEYSVSFT